MKRKHLIPYNIQFFAESGDAGADGGDGADTDVKDGSNDASGTGNDSSGGSGSGGDGKGEKTFTQAEVNKMMTREKREGKKSILSSLGFKTEEDAKKAVSLLNALMDSQKTDADKANDKAKGAEAEKDDAVKRAEAAENKLACVMAGVNKDSVEDVLAIALLKVTEDKNLDKVLEEMKKEKRYGSFFGIGDDSNGSGTGTSPGHSGSGKGKDSKGDYGKMIADSISVDSKKSHFFGED